MPDYAQERTEAPTPRRREEARARGQVARSTDLSAAVILLGGLVILHWSGQDLLAKLLVVMQKYLGAEAGVAVDARPLGTIARHLLVESGRMLLPFLGGLVVLALAIGYLQVGWLITFKPLAPSLERLNPVNGVARMFNARAFVHLLMGVLKMALLVLVAWWTLSGRVDVLANVPGLPHLSVIAVAADLVFTLGLRLAIVLLVLAILDYAYQRHRTEKDLRMTKEEVKEELKRMEGDPKIKARRRQVQMQMALQRIRSAVPKADVVVTNPTEFAVALQYDSETMTAPRVTAKGADYLAGKIREVAIEHGVPIVERPPLARALYRGVEVGQEVPAEFYKAVA
ncbi:MAG: flagellar biosynthesis protein FlhB, partial [Planctomycetes bacterium]|nr:flagellar biosynthesis protein FlhB [Planctomycetota bacterium]